MIFIKKKRNTQCVLCKHYFKFSELSEEHYPARSAGNDDIVSFDFMKMIDLMESGKIIENRYNLKNKNKTLEEFGSTFFDEELSQPLYPKGRTTRSLCRPCNTFLGVYDESYKKFYDSKGDSLVIRGYQKSTKLKIIKAIFAKFLSIPECKNFNFDFINFIRTPVQETYNGEWSLYCIKRDFHTDLLGFGDLETGKLIYDEGIVFELSDENFIFHLTNFEPHECHKSMNMMDILNNYYTLISGTDIENGGYHGELMTLRWLNNMDINTN